jgi:hypothetical protein
MIGERASSARQVAPVETATRRDSDRPQGPGPERIGSDELGSAAIRTNLAPPEFQTNPASILTACAGATERTQPGRELERETSAGARDRTNPAGATRRTQATSRGAEQPATGACQRTCGGVASDHGLDRLQHSGHARATTTLTRPRRTRAARTNPSPPTPVGTRRPPEPWAPSLPTAERLIREARCASRSRWHARPRRGAAPYPSRPI